MNQWHEAILGVLLTVALLVGCRPLTDSSSAAPSRKASDYPWPKTEESYTPLAGRFPPPAGSQRSPVAEGSWKQWLRNLPMRGPATPVRSRGGSVILPATAAVLAGVVDLDIYTNQECADVIMRLWAEFMWWKGRQSEIVFNLTSEGVISWSKWKQGYRPHLQGNKLDFRQDAAPNASRENFQRYLEAVFAWCGTISLIKDSNLVPAHDIQAGDFFIQAGSPGHVVLIVDLVRDQGGRMKALLLQGYMPAQSAHILAHGGGNPWFELVPDQPVDTPRWGAFQWSDLRRMKTR